MRQLPLLVCAALLVVACGTLEEQYQRDMDPIRVRHVDYLASLTTEFFQKTGRMPLADRLQGKTIEVLVTHRPLSASILEQAAKRPIVSLSTSDLKADLEKGLGRTINLPSDPQNYPSYGPNFYIYDVNGVRACVAGHLFFEAPGSFLVEVRSPTTGAVSKYYKYEHCIPSRGPLASEDDSNAPRASCSGSSVCRQVAFLGGRLPNMAFNRTRGYVSSFWRSSAPRAD